MGWRKRVAEIADKHPDKLHPIIKRARGLSASEQCWDRATWQKNSLEGGRPIHLVLQWLQSKSLLTPAGELELAKAESHEYSKLFLAPSLVSPLGASFLEHSYGRWYDTAGINFAIDAESRFDFTELDRLWKGFNRQ
jgi:hypothetical protein